MEFPLNATDPLAAGTLWLAYDNSILTLSILLGSVLLVVGFACCLINYLNRRVYVLGQALMNLGAGVAAPGLFFIMIAIGGSAQDELPTWFILLITIGIPLLGFAGGAYNIRQLLKLGRKATRQAE